AGGGREEGLPVPEHDDGAHPRHAPRLDRGVPDPLGHVSARRERRSAARVVPADRLAAGRGERVGDFFLAPINGLYGLQNPETGTVEPFGVGRLFGAVGGFAFVLAIGAFMTMVLATGARDVAIGRLAYAVRGRPWLVIVAVMGLFSLLGTTMGWADET